MNTFLTVVIMCLLGYVAFVFLAESFNPFKRNRSPINRDRRRGATIIAILLALSGIMGFVDQSNALLDKLGSSLGLAIVLVALAIICLAVVQLYRWLALRREVRAEQRFLLQQSTVDQHVHEPIVAKQIPDDAQAPTLEDQTASDHLISDVRQATPMGDRNDTRDDVVLEPGSVLNTQSAANQSNFMNPEFELQTPANPPASDHSDVVADDLFDSSIVSSEEADNAAIETISDQNLTNNALHDNTAEIEIFEVDESGELDKNSTPAPTYATPLFDNDEKEADAVEWEYIESESRSDELEDTESASGDIDWPAFDNAEVSNGENIIELQAAIVQATEHTEQLDNSVQTITSLTRKEAYYRTRMEEAQIAFEQAKREQLDSQHLEIQRSDQARETEVQSRIEVEKNLSDKLFQLRQVQMRVRELEIALAERQSIFTDQVESLEKTKAMARDAASLARRAAIAQHRARTEALQERAARERVEVSAKKAVDIARNAISKLAEEEKRNRKSAH